MFDAMIADIRDRTVRMVLSVVPSVSQVERVQVAKPISEGFEGDNAKKPKKVRIAKKAEESVGRNDLCPCGSGKKYKKCCGSPANQ